MKSNLFFKYACIKCPECKCMEGYLKHLEKIRYYIPYNELKLELGEESNAAQCHRVIDQNSLKMRRYGYANRSLVGWKAAA